MTHQYYASDVHYFKCMILDRCFIPRIFLLTITSNIGQTISYKMYISNPSFLVFIDFLTTRLDVSINVQNNYIACSYATNSQY